MIKEVYRVVNIKFASAVDVSLKKYRYLLNRDFLVRFVTMASSESLQSNVKVGENRDFVDDYCSPIGEADAGEATKRRRVTHDYKRLSKLGYDPSVSSNAKLLQSSESKGNHLPIPIYTGITTWVLRVMRINKVYNTLDFWWENC